MYEAFLRHCTIKSFRAMASLVAQGDKLLQEKPDLRSLPCVDIVRPAYGFILKQIVTSYLKDYVKLPARIQIQRHPRVSTSMNLTLRPRSCLHVGRVQYA